MDTAISRAIMICMLSIGSFPATAAQIEWTPFDTWTPDATSGSIAFKSGTIDITMSGSGSFETSGHATPGFVTTSADYENIDTATHYAFRTTYNNAGTPWSIEFDFTGTTLSSEDVFTVGQLFASLSGALFTEMTFQMFASDDSTSINLTTIDFEQHALDAPLFDGVLDWNPATGLLKPIAEATSKNSGWGFFSPTTTDIGKIVISATSVVAPDALNYGFGTPVPVPGAVWLFGSGLLALAGARRRKA